MANWAYTEYAIEGPKEALQKIEQAILSHPVKEKSDESWEGNILDALGIKWVGRDQDRKNGLYMRGFITDTEPWYDNGALRFSAEEACGVTDFKKALEIGLPKIKVFYSVEETGEDIYATNDSEGKYFPERYWVDTVQDNVYASEYFNDEKSMWEWLNEKYGVKSMEEVEVWNANYEETGDECENFIYIHGFTIVENND